LRSCRDSCLGMIFSENRFTLFQVMPTPQTAQPS
jgi:hypothetical protein